MDPLVESLQQSLHHAVSASLKSTSKAALSAGAPLIGLSWFLTSVFMTMPSTSQFLQYEPSKERRNERTNEPSSNFGNPVLTLRAAALKNVEKPMQLTLYRFGFSKIISLATFTVLNIPQHGLIKSPLVLFAQLKRTLPSFLLPACCLFLANLFNSYSLSTLGISLTYVTKCSIPIFTLLLSPLLSPSTPPPSLLSKLSLLPICLGIALTSYSNSSFTLKGLSYALTSCIMQVSLNILSKKSMKTTQTSGPQCHMNMVTIGFLLSLLKITLPFPPSRRPIKKHPLVPSSLSLLASLSYHVEYTLSFILISLIQPLTYGVVDAIRRLCIICYGKFLNPDTEERFNRRNGVGMGMALVGGVGYSIFSYKP
ncbi:hypothetical protein TrVE_jg8760 [Triparma verrucosa]|uniref:Sugar phosphate transporter domain-containing protein n=1 Tax=Triparma verrucosa TaxID=1606542 RepID=A0A9W7DNT5_9STRA|nr:hypothetical protein TrVE_jg8760 [Triparma verrucosa]